MRECAAGLTHWPLTSLALGVLRGPLAQRRKSTATDYVAAKGVHVAYIDESRDFITTGYSKHVVASRAASLLAQADPSEPCLAGPGNDGSFGGCDGAGHRSGDRQIYRFDARRLDAPVHATLAGNAPGVLIPYMDATLGVLYVASKVWWCRGAAVTRYVASAWALALTRCHQLRASAKRSAGRRPSDVRRTHAGRPLGLDR